MRVLTTGKGDRIEVGISGRFVAVRTVRMAIGDVDLQPDEARRLATALLEHAADAERRGGGRR